MPTFGKKSLEMLNQVHPDLFLLFMIVSKSVDCTILCGMRTKAEQNRLFKIKRSKLKWPNSKHNIENPGDLSRAVDVAPYFEDRNPHIIWPDPAIDPRLYAKQVGLYYHFAGYVRGIADQIGVVMRWGGDWDRDGIFSDQTFDDLVHFELV